MSTARLNSMAAFTTAATTTTSAAAARTAGSRNKFENGHGEEKALQQKTFEFFQLCDIENKGFITRRDMQRLSGELPLSAEELENVFDTLDSDGNGFLTLEEFSFGFKNFLHGHSNGPSDPNMNVGFKSSPEVLYQSHWEESLATSEDEEEKHFCMLMENLGANKVFEDPAEVRSLWAQLRRDEPDLLSNFEDFLARVTSQIVLANQEKREMESALQRKAATHDNEIQHLYQEMEQQIKSEKDRIMLEQYLSRSQTLEHQLTNKEKEEDELFQKQKLESQCQELQSEQHVTKVENVKLKQTNDELARELEHTTDELVLVQEQLSILQDRSARFHEEKEIEIYRLTEGLQRERASFLKQLDLMREMNKHLRDEKDICNQNPKYSMKHALAHQRPFLSKQPSIFKSEGEDPLSPTTKQNLQNGWFPHSFPKSSTGFLQRIISIEEDHLPHLLQMDHLARRSLEACSEGEEVLETDGNSPLNMRDPRVSQLSVTQEDKTITSPRGQPVGKDDSVIDESYPSPPDRLFKIILVGNSSVGKTSLLKRFCDDSFHSGTSATVGIDYSVKTIMVDNSQVALQLWDTAGQERYHSITKQFFRKADAVVVMYDITSERSFTAVRQWLTSVKEGAGEEISVMLLGNKRDKEAEREVDTVVGERLAKESSMSFSECSAYSGLNVSESMLNLARTLKEQEDRAKEKTVQLVGSPSEKRRPCC